MSDKAEKQTPPPSQDEEDDDDFDLGINSLHAARARQMQRKPSTRNINDSVNDFGDSFAVGDDSFALAGDVDIPIKEEE